MFIEMHLHVLADIEDDHIMTHAITEEIERQLEREFGHVVATIHVEPLPAEKVGRLSQTIVPP